MDLVGAGSYGAPSDGRKGNVRRTPQQSALRSASLTVRRWPWTVQHTPNCATRKGGGVLWQEQTGRVRTAETLHSRAGRCARWSLRLYGWNSPPYTDTRSSLGWKPAPSQRQSKTYECGHGSITGTGPSPGATAAAVQQQTLGRRPRRGRFIRFVERAHWCRYSSDIGR